MVNETLFKNTLNNLDESVNFSLEKSVKSIIKKAGYVTYSVDLKVITPDGGNYFGIICAVDIKGKTSEGVKETNMFIKIKDPNEQVTMLSLSDAYLKELFIYQELSNIFTELQNEIELPEEKCFKIVKSYEESNMNMIILENMAKKGYQTYFRMDVPSIEYAELGVKELAKFHGLSFVFETRKPNYFDIKIKSLEQPFSFDSDWDGFVENMCKITLNSLDRESRRTLEAVIPTFKEKFSRFMKSGQRCLCHGDYRVNNILIKEEEGRILEVIPVDYQLVYYGCPVMDLIYFLFPASDQMFRRKHLTYLKKLYYQTLKQFLNYFSLDIEMIYPKDDFERDFKERQEYGLMISINLIPFLMECNDLPDIATEPMSTLSFNVDERCKKRLVDLVHDFIDWGYL